jgi:hypothetical protein
MFELFHLKMQQKFVEWCLVDRYFFEILPFAGKWLKLENITLSEVNQVHKAKKTACFLSYVEYRPKTNTSNMKNRSC